MAAHCLRCDYHQVTIRVTPLFGSIFSDKGQAFSSPHFRLWRARNAGDYGNDETQRTSVCAEVNQAANSAFSCWKLRSRTHAKKMRSISGSLAATSENRYRMISMFLRQNALVGRWPTISPCVA